MFDGAGFKAEQLAQRQFGGELVKDLEMQYKDIDLVIKGSDGADYSVSIKDQLWSSGKYGGMQIETELYNSSNDKTMVGCFYSNASDYYLWRLEIKGEDSWFIVKTQALRDWVEENKETLIPWKTRLATEQKNSSLGRYYNGAKGLTLTITDALLSIGSVKGVKK